MLKKILALILALMLAVSLVACGGSSDEAEENEAVVEETTEEVAEEVVEEEVTEEAAAESDLVCLWDVKVNPIPELEGTTWNFAGGVANGVELNQDQVDAAYAAAEGAIQFVFEADGVFKNIQGNAEFTGTWEVIDEVSVIATIEYETEEGTAKLAYVCLFTELNGTVLVAVDGADMEGYNGLFFIPAE